MIKTHMLDKIGSILLIINGLICLFFSHYILNLLPTICGFIILMKGIAKFIYGIKSEEYKSLEKVNFEKSIAIIAIGLGILFKQEDALFVVGIFWGLYGMTNSVSDFNIAFYNYFNKEKYGIVLIRGVFGFILSFILIFDPFESIHHHILILGLELMLEGTIEFFKKENEEKV